MEFHDIVKQRYAAKKFDGRKLPQEKVDELLEMVRLSASSFNIQPWRVKVVTDQKVKDELMALSWNQPQVGTASHVLVFCADTDVTKNIDRLEQMMPGADKYIEMMRGFAKGMTPDQIKAWAQKQVYIAMANALNGAKALGFDSCPMEGFDPKGYAKALKLPESLVPTVVVPIGYAADKPMPKLRFAKKDIFF